MFSQVCVYSPGGGGLSLVPCPFLEEYLWYHVPSGGKWVSRKWVLTSPPHTWDIMKNDQQAGSTHPTGIFLLY